VSLLDLHVIFFIASVLLLVLELVFGMALGAALAGSIAFFCLGVTEYLGLIHGFNNYLIIGSIFFVGSLVLVMKYFRNSIRKIQSGNDVNDY
jgi:membrane protein implicated in regulation of membrane protease activity